MTLLNLNMSAHDLNCWAAKDDCVEGAVLEVDIDLNGALLAHLDALGEVVPSCGCCLLVTALGTKIGGQTARGGAGGGIFEAVGHHARAQLNDGNAIGSGGAGADVVEAADEAGLPVLVEEALGVELAATGGDVGEQLQRRQLDEGKGDALDEAEDGGGELQLANSVVGLQLDGGDAGVGGEGGGVQVDVVRDGGRGRIVAGAGDGDAAGLCDELGDGVGGAPEQGDGGADGGVAGEGDLGVGEEDVDLAGVVCFWVGDVVDEDGLGEVELAGDDLLLVLGGLGGAGGDGDDGEGVAAEAGAGEDVEGDEGELHCGRLGLKMW